MYDIIVIGARVAGSPTAMLLARKGFRVLLLDRASFPSDTLSTHQVQVPGGATLKRWGLLEKVLSTQPGAATGAQMDLESFVLKGSFPMVNGVHAVHSPRRTILDKILVDAAVEAGVELREGFIVEELTMSEGRVTGVRGRTRQGTAISETARIVVGADGKHSLVAGTVRASQYNEVPALTCAYYSYWSGEPLDHGEIYSRGLRRMGAWPTNDGLTMIYTAWPVAEFHAFRADVEGNYLKTIQLAPGLAERAGQRVEPIRGTADLPNFLRKPYGQGWALVGDAGLVQDPITGAGISDAFRDAGLLVEALEAGLSGREPLEQALARYEQQRNEAALPLYQFTLETASMRPPTPEQQQLLSALRGNHEATDQFFGVLTGAVSPKEFFAPSNLLRIMGFRGMAKIMAQRLLPVRKRNSIATPPLQA